MGSCSLHRLVRTTDREPEEFSWSEEDEEDEGEEGEEEDGVVDPFDAESSVELSSDTAASSAAALSGVATPQEAEAEALSGADRQL